MSSQDKPLRWGILATGWIASMFTKDLMLDPKSRNVSDVAHTVVAAASSSSADRAKKFLEECGCPSDAKAYGSYRELVNDPNVDIIYIATPHSHHYQNARLVLEANKHVLCEKSLTTNAEQARILIDLAKKNNLFFMEAVWTRYFPLSIELRKFVEDGKLGEVRRVFADNSFGEDPEKKWGSKHRMLNMDLAGGALLDLGIYSLTWVFQFLYHVLPENQRSKPTVLSSQLHYETGADEQTTIICTFPTTRSQGIATTGLRAASDPSKDQAAGPSIRIQGTRGEIQVFPPAFRPTKYRLIPNKDMGADFEYKEVEKDIPGHGMFWEADECYRCLKDGRKESQGLGWEESIVIMQVMDEVRKQNGMVYPEKIESLDYPLEGF